MIAQSFYSEEQYRQIKEQALSISITEAMNKNMPKRSHREHWIDALTLLGLPLPPTLSAAGEEKNSQAEPEDDHLPISNNELVLLLGKVQNNDPSDPLYQETKTRLVRAIPGMTNPRPTSGLVYDAMDELIDLYACAFEDGLLLHPNTVGRLQQLTS